MAKHFVYSFFVVTTQTLVTDESEIDTDALRRKIENAVNGVLEDGQHANVQFETHTTVDHGM